MSKGKSINTTDAREERLSNAMMVRYNRERSGNCYKVRLMLSLLGLARIAQLRSYLPIPAYDGAGGPLVE